MQIKRARGGVHLASHGLYIGLSWSRMHTTIERELCFVGFMWPPMASHLASLGLVLASLKRPRSSRGASPGRLWSIRDALVAHFAPLRTAVRARKQRLLVARASNRPGSAPDRAPPRTRLRPGPGSSLVVRASNRLGSAPDRAPPRTGKQHWDGLGCWATGGQD